MIPHQSCKSRLLPTVSWQKLLTKLLSWNSYEKLMLNIRSESYILYLPFSNGRPPYISTSQNDISWSVDELILKYRPETLVLQASSWTVPLGKTDSYSIQSSPDVTSSSGYLETCIVKFFNSWSVTNTYKSTYESSNKTINIILHVHRSIPISISLP